MREEKIKRFIDEAKKISNNVGFTQRVARIQSVVLKVGCPKWCLHFAKDVKGADVKAHQNVVLSGTLDDAHTMYLFAKYVVGADLKLIMNRIKEVDKYYRLDHKKRWNELQEKLSTITNE